MLKKMTIDGGSSGQWFEHFHIHWLRSHTDAGSITSNKAFSDWTELFHDPVIVTAILDRLLHHSTIINIRGNSYRLMGKTAEEALAAGQNTEKVAHFSRPKMAHF